MNPLLEAAVGYAALGWRVFPCWWPKASACACPKGAACDRSAKHPLAELAPHGLLDATVDETTIRNWWARFPEANVAIATGQASNLFVVDVDGQKGGWAALEALEAKHGELPYSLRTRSGSGQGGHRLFAHPNSGTRISSTTTKLGAGLDVRGDGGYIVAPPSLHASGRRYTWEDEDESRLEPAPAWLLELVVAKERTAPPETPVPELPLLELVKIAERRLGRALEKAVAGSSRHNTWVETVALLRDDLVPRELAALLVPRFKRACDARVGDRVVPEEELRKVVADVYATPRREPSPGVAEAVAAAQASTGPLLIRDALAEPEPEVSFLLKPLLPVGALLLLASYGGLGKSTLLVQLLASLAAGLPFLGFAVPQAVPTLYLIAEGSRHVFLERVHVAIRRLGLDPATLPLWVSPRGFRPCIGPEVESFIATSGARVVALDTIGLFHDGDENSASDFKSKVVKPLRDIMGRHDVSFVLVAHQGKPSEERKGRHTIRGTSAMVDDVDVALRLVAPEGDRAPGRVLSFDKVRTGESPASVALEFDFSSATFSRVGDEVLEARQEERDAAAAEKRTKDLEVAIVRYLKREPEGLTKAELLGELHARKADLVQALDRLREAGRAFPERAPGSRGLRWRLATPPTGGSK